MAATTAGALKAHIETLGLKLPVFRDGPRPGQAVPYAVVTEGISAGIAPNTGGDYGDPNADITIIENVTVEVVQAARVKTGEATTATVERYGLVEALAYRLHACRLPAHPARVTAVKLQDIDRFPITDNRVRSAIHLTVTRQLLTSEVTPA